MQVQFKRTVSGFTEDMAVVTGHFQSATGQLLNQTQMNAVAARFQTWWQVWVPLVSSLNILDQFRFYDQQVWPTKSPLLQVNDVSDFPGTATGQELPPQIAVSCTLETATRRRWGRFYMLAPNTGSITDNAARLNTTVLNTLAQALRDYVQGCKTDGAIPVVWSPRGGSGPPPFAAGATEPVTGVRMDDILDVVRRRRWQDAPTRVRYTIT